MIVLAAALCLRDPNLPAIPVDFRLAGQTAGTPQGAAIGLSGAPFPLAPNGQAADGATAPDTTVDASTPAAPPKPHISLAQGFGHDVPLVFAVRQVVPLRVHITYGPGVDEGQHVSWEGGKPWDQVLRSTIKPLGLHLVMSHMAVRIVE